MARVVVLHTSDIHNRLTPDRARFLHRLKSELPQSLMVDSGDAIWAGNVFWRPGGERVLDLMNAVPYDAMCMGNREFHPWRAGILSKTSRARFPVLSANLRQIDGDGSCDQFAPFVTLDCGGMCVGVFGLSVPCVKQGTLIGRFADFCFEDPIEAAARIVPTLRDRCGLVVALTHIGLKHDRELAAAVPGIDLILGGHTHTVTQTPEKVERTWIVHSGFHCREVRKVDIDCSAGSINLQSELIRLPVR